MEFCRSARDLGDGAGVGSRDQDHRGLRGVAERRQGRAEARFLHLEARMRPQAAGAAVVVGEETAPGLGQAEQSQRVAGGCGVEDHMLKLAAVFRQQRRKLIKGRNLRRAGPRELLAHGCPFRGGAAGGHLGDHALAVGFRSRARIDIEHREPRGIRHRRGRVAQRDAEHFVQIGGRIGADQQHRLAGIGQCQRGSRRQRGLADAAFPGKEQIARWRLQEPWQAAGAHHIRSSGTTKSLYGSSVLSTALGTLWWITARSTRERMSAATAEGTKA